MGMRHVRPFVIVDRSGDGARATHAYMDMGGGYGVHAGSVPRPQQLSFTF